MLNRQARFEFTEMKTLDKKYEKGAYATYILPSRSEGRGLSSNM